MCVRRLRAAVSLPPRGAAEIRGRRPPSEPEGKTHPRSPATTTERMIAALARDAKREAEAANERRVLVLAGDRDRGIDAAYDAIEAVGSGDDERDGGEEDDDERDGGEEDDDERESVSVVSAREGFRCEGHRPRNADELLGRTREVVVLGCHERFDPNALGE
jgi:tRNA(Met) cytidine acetyltransferase